MTARHLRPRPNEIAAVLVAPGESVVVVTERGPETIHGDDLVHPYAEVRLVLVPYCPATAGWGSTHFATWGVGPGDARTPTGVRAPVLRRILRGHKLDEETWADARLILGGPARAVYIRMGEVGYFSRKRIAAIEARIPEEQRCRCDGGSYQVVAHPFLVHPDCPIHANREEAP